MLGIIAIAITLLLLHEIKVRQLSIPWWVEGPSFLGIYGLLYWYYDNYGWYQLSFLPWRTIDLRGTWEGRIRSSFDSNVETICVLHIQQSWTKMRIELETTNSFSKSIMANVKTEGTCELNYSYLNEPRALATETMSIHRGVAFLRLQTVSNRLCLVGEYFTGRGRSNHGELHFIFLAKKHMSIVEIQNLKNDQN